MYPFSKIHKQPQVMSIYCMCKLVTTFTLYIFEVFFRIKMYYTIYGLYSTHYFINQFITTIHK